MKNCQSPSSTQRLPCLDARTRDNAARVSITIISQTSTADQSNSAPMTMAMWKAGNHTVLWTVGRRTLPRLCLCIFLWRRSRFPWRYGTRNLFLSSYPNICLFVSLGSIQPPVWKQKFTSQEDLLSAVRVDAIHVSESWVRPSRKITS